MGHPVYLAIPSAEKVYAIKIYNAISVYYVYAYAYSSLHNRRHLCPGFELARPTIPRATFGDAPPRRPSLPLPMMRASAPNCPSPGQLRGGGGGKGRGSPPALYLERHLPPHTVLLSACLSGWLAVCLSDGLSA